MTSIMEKETITIDYFHYADSYFRKQAQWQAAAIWHGKVFGTSLHPTQQEAKDALLGWIKNIKPFYTGSEEVEI